MGLLITHALALAVLAGCQPAPAPVFDPDKPHRYRVLRGDTWQSIASKRQSKPEEIRRWNQLPENHLLIPGQALWIFPGGRGAPEPDELEVADAVDEDTEEDTEATDGIAAATPGDSTEAPAPKASKRRQVRSDVGPGGTALLSMLDDVEQMPALQPVPSVQPAGNPMDAIMATRRGNLGGGGEVDTTSVEIDRRAPAPAPTLKMGPGGVPKLPKASPKTCLRASMEEDVGDYGMATASGLTKDAIRAGMRPVQRAVQACLASGSGGPHELHLEVSLGCDGLVYQTTTVQDAGLPRPVTDCVEGVADQASFAAAAGATTFLYPIILGY